METAAGIKIGHIVIDVLRQDKENSDGSHWKRNTKLASARVYAKVRQYGGTTEDAENAAEQTKIVMDAAAESVRGTQSRYSHAIRLVLYSLDNPLER